MGLCRHIHRGVVRNMYKIAIVEDEASCREELLSLLKRYEREKNVQFEVVQFADGMDFLIAFRADFDLIFFDIEMSHSNGMDIAQRIREKDDTVGIIFVTRLAQFAVRGYNVSAVGFIVKPIRYDDLAFSLEKALRIADQNSAGNTISFIAEGQSYRMPISSILYVEVIKHRIVIHTDQGNYEIWHKTMNEMEKQLQPYSFARCNVSYLVNLRYVSAVNPNTVRVGKEELTVTRGRRQEFLAALSAYLGGE